MEDIFQNGNYDRLNNTDMTSSIEEIRKEVRTYVYYILYTQY